MKLESLGRRRHFHPAVDQQRENTPTYGQYRQPWINNVKTHTDIRTIPTAVDQQRQRKSELVRIRPIKGRSIKASIKASVKESIKASISRQASNHRQACASFPTCASCHLRVLPPARLAHLYNLRALPPRTSLRGARLAAARLCILVQNKRPCPASRWFEFHAASRRKLARGAGRAGSDLRPTLRPTK